MHFRGLLAAVAPLPASVQGCSEVASQEADSSSDQGACAGCARASKLAGLAGVKSRRGLQS